MSPGLSRWTRNTFSAAYQLGAPDQVGVPPADAVRGSCVGASSRLLRSLVGLAQVADPTERRLIIHVFPSPYLLSSAAPFLTQAGLWGVLSILDGRVVEEWTSAPVFPPAVCSHTRPGVIRESSMARRVGPANACSAV